MVKNNKTLLRKAAGTMSEWPAIGRLVRIGVAIIRLPEFKAASLAQFPAMQQTITEMNQRQHVLEIEKLLVLQKAISDVSQHQLVLEAEKLMVLQQSIAEMNQRQLVLETEKLPVLQQSIADLSQRQLSCENDLDNLVKSIPVALRKITRELIDIRSQLQNVTRSAEHIDKT